jgi:amino acid transporter
MSRGPGLSGKLSLPDVIAQSVGFMGPVFAVSFLLPLLVGLNAAGQGAGAAAPLAVLLAAAGVLALSWIVAQYARRIAAAGSLYAYVSHGLGARVGGAAGILYYAGIIVLGAAIGPLLGGTVHDTLEAEFGGAVLPVWGWQLLFLAGLLAIVHRGVRISTRTQLWLALVSIVVLAVFFVGVIVQVGGDNSASAFAPGSADQGWGGILFAILYGVLLFVGFETAANLAEETAQPKRDIPKAMVFSVVLATGFFVLGTYAQVAGYTFDVKTMADAAAAPLFGLGEPYGNIWIRRVLELVVVLDMIAVFIGVSVAATRGVFALARDRWLPAPLAKVSARRGTPVGGTALIAVVYLLTILTPNLFPRLIETPGLPPYVSVFSWLVAFGSFSLAVIYLLVSIGAVRGLADHPRRLLVYGCAAVGMFVTGAAVFGTLYKVPSPTIYAVYTALAVLVIGVVVALVRRAPASQETIAEPKLTAT